jgi:hypothetical protein
MTAQMAGWTVPGSSGWAMGGTGPRSGSTGNSAGLGALSPGSKGPSSEGWGRWVENMQEEYARVKR